MSTLYIFLGVNTLVFKYRHLMQAFGYWYQVSIPAVTIYKTFLKENTFESRFMLTIMSIIYDKECK